MIPGPRLSSGARSMNLPLLFVVLTAAAPPPDVFFEQTTVPLSAGRRAGPGVVSRVWASGRRLRMEAVGGGGGALILRLDEGRAWRLDAPRRTAVALDVA